MEQLTLEISKLHHDPSNARKHSVANISAIKGSLAKFGQQKPIVIDANNVVIAGNGTLEAAKQLGWTEIAAVKSELKGAEAIAFALADNRTAELASWDNDILSQTLQSLRESDFDLNQIGFDVSYLDSIYQEAPQVEGAKELSESEFNEFEKKCPRCGFEFDGK